MPAVTSTDAVRPGHFGLTVPDHWARFDLSDAPIARARRELMKTATNPVARMQVDDMVRQAQAINQAARRNGALWGAGTATLYDDVLFIGHVMVFAVSTGGDGAEVNVQELVRQLSEPAPADRAEPAAEARTTESESVSGTESKSGTVESGAVESGAAAARAVGTVALPQVGEAARITGTETVAITADAKVEMLTMNTLVPVPTAAGQFMLVTCCSPNLSLAEEVYELFDAITSTFYFVKPERTR